MELPCGKACRNIEHASVYRRAPARRAALLALAVALYAVVLPYAWNTMGEPRRRATAEADVITARKLQDEEDLFEQGEAAEVVVSWGDEDEDAASEAAVDLADAEAAKAADEALAGGAADAKAAKKKAKKAKTFNFEGVDGDISNLGIDDEDEEAEERPLPSPYLPDAGAVAALFMLVSGTILFNLLCHWLVWFEAWAYYTPADKVEPGYYVLVMPYAHRGKPALVKVYRDNKTGNCTFDFQRQKFELAKDIEVSEVKLLGLAKASERLDHDDEDLAVRKLSPAMRAECEKLTAEATSKFGAFVPVISRVDLPVSHYLKSRGLATREQVDNELSRFGVNSVEVAIKSMPELVKEGMLSPLAMFQFFSAALWLMDEYWQYTIFNLFSIVMMEAVTAFQRFRTLRTLKGLAPKPYELPAFREGKWTMVKTTELLPGDLISLSSSTHTVATAEGAAAAAAGIKKGKGTDAVPCDCLILHGSAVVNEATLTGESVPQMKDALKTTSHSDTSVKLDVQGHDRVHVMFSGTTLISATPGDEDKNKSKEAPFPKAPDGGCLCYVLRTGFGSSQGELMQMIEFSTEQVSADSRETGMALLVLLFFAICSAGYVFKRGMEKGDRTTHELLLKCIIILTSVVPRQLPIQMALAVNHALMTLMKEGIFCTEPYRVPYSGKITHCLFDKTGTLTTDELVPAGIVNAAAELANADEPSKVLKPVKEASREATMVLAACHSLVAMPEAPAQTGPDGRSLDSKPAVPRAPELLGDPIELAAMRGVQWSFDPRAEKAAPGDLVTMNAAVLATKLKAEAAAAALQQLRQKQPAASAAELKLAESNLEHFKAQLAKLIESFEAAKKEAAQSPVQDIKILQRYHFSSKLQRMSVLCRVRERGSNEYSRKPLCLVKGSPEAILKLLKAAPSWYQTTYRALAEQGMRVLALGVKECSSDVDTSKLSRDEAEQGLDFAGFIAFECKIRADSAMVIKSLREADHQVAMLTGDAPLTALHVARSTNICGDETRRDNAPLLLTVSGSGSDCKVEWVGAIGPQESSLRVPFVVDEMPSLADKHDLITTEDALLQAVDVTEGRIWKHVDLIQVFARMSPQGKAKVIRMIQQYQEGDVKVESKSVTAPAAAAQQTKFVMMVGDGGNDVGALKQADVGLALLSGYGNANTDDATLTPGEEGGDAEAALNAQAQEQRTRQKQAEKLKKAEFAQKKKEIMARQRQMVEEEVKRAAERGETGIMVNVSAVKKVAGQVRAELAKEAELLNRKYNINISKDDKDKDPTELAMEALDDPNALPVVRPGDASVAAPFTSRIPSVRSAIQLIRQGRCTLLSALQQQQIMCLECVINAYCLAALSLEGARSSERQMMASSWLIMTASLAFSYSTPVDKMHPVRPIRSLFHPATALSILGQAAIHLFCMVAAVNLAKEAMGEERIQEVIAFNRRVSRGLEKKMAEEGDALDAVAEVFMMWSTPFMPNLLNTVIFLVETSQIMAVLFVNYKGRPWMLGMVENHALFLSLFLCIAALLFATFEMSPELNRLVHLHEFPDNEFRFKIIGLVFLTLFGTFLWDRIVTAVCAPRIFRAMMEQAFQTTFSDVVPIFATLGKVIVGFVVFSSGSPIVWIGCWWLYRKYNANREAAEVEAVEARRKAIAEAKKKDQ